MLPAITSISTFNIQTPLVNTATPGTTVVHVPYDNVAPSVSSAQADNNSGGNVIFAQGAAQETPPAPVSAQTSESGGNFARFLQGSGSAAPSGVQAAFVAQLAAQDDGPPAQVILLQYQQLVANSNVKYKPSNADKPSLDVPAHAFSRLLHSEKAPQPVAPPPQAPAPQAAAASASSAQAAIEAITVSLPVAEAPAPPPRSSKAASEAETPAPTAHSNAAPGANNAASSAVGAYASAAARVGSLSTTAMELA